MDESTEELKANMEKAFAERVEADQKLTALADHLNSGKGTYVTAEQYAYETGKVLSGVFREQITEEKLLEGVFTREFVQETIEPLLKDDHKIVSTMAAVAQENINTAAGEHIQPQKADFNQDRADGFATKMDGKTMEEAGWMLGSPVTNFSQSIVDETMIKNGKVLAKAGKAAIIKRQAEAKCCDWCLNKAGTYDATNREAYQRHRECRCEIEMHLDGSVKRQEDWKKNRWKEQKENIRAASLAIKQEHEMRRKEIISSISQHYERIETVGVGFPENRYAEITVHRVKGIKNEVFISEKANASLRIIKNIDHDVSYAIKAYGGDVNKRPRIVVVAPEELKTGVFAKYDEINNTIYAIPQTGDRRKILELQKDAGGVCANNPKASMFHETWHWMQAQDYRKNVAPIQQNGHAEYMETVSNRSKERLDKAGINEYNVGKISGYARIKYGIGRFDEAEAEYNTLQALKR